MNPQKKPRTSLYSDQLTKHWSNCSAGFEDLPSSNRSSTKESQKKKFKYEGWEDRWEEEEEEKEEEVDIVWSSSSEDEDTGVKGIRTLNKSGIISRQSAASEKRAGRRIARKKSSRHGKAAMASRNNMSWDARDTSLEDSIIGDSSSDEDNRGSPGQSGVQAPKDGSPPRAETRTAGVETVGICEGPQRKEKEATLSARVKSGNTGKASHFVDRGRRQYIQSKQVSFEPEILDDSPSEEESPLISEVMISEPSSASQSSWSRGHPNTSTTTTTTSPKSNPMGSPRTGSEWVKKLKLQASITPERSAGAGEDTRGAGSASGGAGAGIVDSARKKKKFVSSGLAERLQRLVSREKSSIAMWYHNQADSQNSQQEPTKSGLVVKILSCETHRGLYLTHCVTQVSGKSKVTDGSKVKGGGDQAGCNQGDEMYVFFTRSTGDKLGLAKDMLISIHTPWQKLSIPDVSKPVVLCTYFCQPVNLDPSDIVQHQPILPECPTEGSKSPKVLNPMRLFPAAAASSHSPSADIAPTQENKARNISASIMQSVSETGACSSSGISFKATVQRIVTRRQQTVVPHQSARVISSRNSVQAQASPSLIKSLLLQDREGVVCEVQLTNQMAESNTWQQVLQLGEGRSYIFKNLRVTQRLTLARAPGLSTMIRSLQQHHPDQMSGQTVCYVLTSELGMTAVEAIERSESAEVPPHKPPAVMDLCDVVKNTQTPKKRTSFSATPILLSPTSPDHVIPSSGLKDTSNNPVSWFLFLSTSAVLHHHHSTAPREESTSHSRGPDKYVRLHVHQSNVLGEEVLMRLKNGENRTRIFCRDILVTSTQDGVFLNADGFSYISTEDDSEVESMPDVVLSVLKVDSRLHSLVRVSGNICGVEEETTFSWPACPQCGNNHLDGGEGSGFVLHCSQCKKDVNSPLIRMHLIVLLSYPTLPSESTVKVQLLQSTIESVLPSPSSQTSGGHDLQSILGVLIGPMNCLVRTVSESSERKVFLLEEVLLLNCGFAGTVGIV